MGQWNDPLNLNLGKTTEYAELSSTLLILSMSYPQGAGIFQLVIPPSARGDGGPILQ